MSEDDGVTWKKQYSYTGSDYGGYSDIARYPDGTIGYYMNMVSRISEALLFRMLSCHSYNKTCVELKNRLI